MQGGQSGLAAQLSLKGMKQMARALPFGAAASVPWAEDRGARHGGVALWCSSHSAEGLARFCSKFCKFPFVRTKRGNSLLLGPPVQDAHRQHERPLPGNQIPGMPIRGPKGSLDPPRMGEKQWAMAGRAACLEKKRTCRVLSHA